MQIKGKNGKPKCCYRVPCSKRSDTCGKYCVKFGCKDGKPYLEHCREVGEEYVKKLTIQFRFQNQLEGIVRSRYLRTS